MKLDRAKQHLGELEQALKSFYDTKPYRFSGKSNLATRIVVYSMDSVTPVPEEIPLIAGDIIQNLRSALDHLAYQLYLRGGGSAETGRHIYFPICESKTVYEDKKRRQTRGMTQQAIAAIDAVQPYKGGNDVLWRLSELNNIDKHRLIFTVGSGVRSLDLGSYMQQHAPPGSLLSQAQGLSAFFKPKNNDYPLEIGTVILADQTT